MCVTNIPIYVWQGLLTLSIRPAIISKQTVGHSVMDIWKRDTLIDHGTSWIGLEDKTEPVCYTAKKATADSLCQR